MKVMFYYHDKGADNNLYTYDYFKEQYFHPKAVQWIPMAEVVFNDYVNKGEYVLEGTVV